MNRTLPLSLTLLATSLVEISSAQVVYSNDFETDAHGFTAGGTLASLSTTSLPTDGDGLGSASQSTWLGRLGAGVDKSATPELATLALTGLTLGTTYAVAFDLLVGASWDGSANGYGSDAWRCTVDGTNLVNTTFSNGKQGVDFGAYSPQRYSDATYNSPNDANGNPIGSDFDRFTGADAYHTTNTGGYYAEDYGIYRFSRGVGNPYLTFVATGGTATVEFARYGTSTDSADEYWALDNVEVAAVPEPGAFAVLSLGTATLLRRRRSITRRR